MHSLALWAALFLGAEPQGAAAPPDGTLLFLENCNRLVEAYTKCTIGHVAMVLREDGTAYVYEATPDKVRRLTVAEYYAEIARTAHDRKREIKIWIVEPKTPYTAEQTERMLRYCNLQMSRRYSIANYFHKREHDGIHCAEFTANTLNEGKVCERFAHPYCETPASLLDSQEARHQPRKRIELPAYKPQETWTQKQARRWNSRFIWCCWSVTEAAIWLDATTGWALGY